MLIIRIKKIFLYSDDLVEQLSLDPNYFNKFKLNLPYSYKENSYCDNNYDDELSQESNFIEKLKGFLKKTKMIRQKLDIRLL